MACRTMDTVCTDLKTAIKKIDKLLLKVKVGWLGTAGVEAVPASAQLG